MGRRDDQRKIKLAVLSKIHKKKDILFGTFSPTLTKEDKRVAWAGVSAHARRLGVAACGARGNPNYMRDVWWQNARKSTMEKLDIAKEPGGAEIVAKRWNEFDDLILQIINKEAPEVDAGVDVTRAGERAEAGGSDGDSACDLLDGAGPEGDKDAEPARDPLLQGDGDAEGSGSVKKEDTRQLPAEARPGVSFSRDNNSRFKLEKPEPYGSKAVVRSKVELEMELLRIQIYVARLQARQLEVALLLPPSAHTAGLAAPAPARAARRRQLR